MMCASKSVSDSPVQVGSLPSSAAGAGGLSSLWARPANAGASAGPSKFENSSAVHAKGFDDLKR
eukprot:1989823-Pyramimonas_sp.AAC.1